jgi:hypothetical protein
MSKLANAPSSTKGLSEETGANFKSPFFGTSDSKVLQQIAPLAGLAVLVLLFFLPITVGDRLPGGDTLYYYLPAFKTAPTLWLSSLSSGMPIAADPQWQTWYPLTRLFAAVSDFNAFVIAAYVVAILSMYLFAFDLTKSKVGAAIGAITYCLGGFMMAHAGHTTIVHVSAWLPLIMFATRRYILTGFWHWCVLGQVGIAMSVLAGHPQIALLQLILVSSYSIYLAIENRHCAKRVCAFLLIGIPLGIALASIQVVPTTEFMQQSTRSRIDYDEFVSYSLDPHRLALFFFPLIFGADNPTFITKLKYFGNFNLSELSCFIGMTPLLLATMALREPKNRSRWFWLTMFLIGVLFSSGASNPLSPLLYHVPVLSSFRCPVRYFLFANFSACVLAAMGTSWLLSPGSAINKRHAAIVSSACVALTALFFLWIATPTLHTEFALNTAYVHSALPVHILKVVGVWLFFMVSGSFTIIALSSKPNSKRLVSILVLLTILDIGSFSFLRTALSADNIPKDLVAKSESFRNRVSDLDNTQYRFLEPLGVLDFTPYLYAPNAYLLIGLRGSTYYGPLRVQRYQDLLSLDKNGGGDASPALAYPDRSLDLVSAKYITISTRAAVKMISITKALINKARFRSVGEILPGFLLFENHEALPRFRFVDRVVEDSKAAVLKTIKTSMLSNGETFDPRTTALVEEDVRLPQIKSSSPASFKLLKDENESIAFTTKSKDTRFFVVSDQFYPGWNCRIDGNPTNIIRTNYCMRGIVVPSGEHNIEMAYKPISFVIGLTITIATVLLNLLLALLFWRLSKNKSNVP